MPRPSKSACCATLVLLAANFSLSLAHSVPQDTTPVDHLLRIRGNAFLPAGGDAFIGGPTLPLSDLAFGDFDPAPRHTKPFAPPRPPSHNAREKRATVTDAVFPPSSFVNINDLSSIALLAEAAVNRMQTWYIAPNVQWTPWWQFALLGMVYSTLDIAFGNAANKVLIEDFLGEWAYTGYMIDAYIDDQSWWSMFLLRSYQAHGNETWLRAAEVINTNSSAYWNDQCGGGVIWLTSQPESKNTITNGLYFSTVARLYRHTGNPVDYENAVRTLNWWLTWGFDADTGKVYDTMGYPGCMSNRTGLDAWSYNSGAFLFGLADLYYATGNETLLDIGRSIAYAAMRDFSILETGIIQEHCEHDPAPPNSGLPTGCQQDEVAFKGILMLALGELYVARPDPNIYNYVNTNLMSVVYNNIDKSWLFGQWWEGPWNETTAGPKTQISTLCLVAAAATINGNFIARSANGTPQAPIPVPGASTPAASSSGPSSYSFSTYVGAGVVTLGVGLGLLV